MAIGGRPEARQGEMFVVASEIRAGGNPFYRALDRLLRENGFDVCGRDVPGILCG